MNLIEWLQNIDMTYVQDTIMPIVEAVAVGNGVAALGISLLANKVKTIISNVKGIIDSVTTLTTKNEENKVAVTEELANIKNEYEKAKAEMLEIVNSMPITKIQGMLDTALRTNNDGFTAIIAFRDVLGLAFDLFKGVIESSVTMNQADKDVLLAKYETAKTTLSDLDLSEVYKRLKGCENALESSKTTAVGVCDVEVANQENTD